MSKCPVSGTSCHSCGPGVCYAAGTGVGHMRATGKPPEPKQQEQVIQDANYDPHSARGLRYNKGKRRFDLIPPDAMALVADIFTIGAEKYAERNWEKGMPWAEVAASLERHFTAWKAGEDRDAETGQLHMAHVVWNALALLTYQLRNIGTDNRVKVTIPDTVRPT